MNSRFRANIVMLGCLYLIFVGVQLLMSTKDADKGDPVIGIIGGIAFILIGVVFGYFSYKRIKAERARAKEDLVKQLEEEEKAGGLVEVEERKLSLAEKAKLVQITEEEKNALSGENSLHEGLSVEKAADNIE